MSALRSSFLLGERGSRPVFFVADNEERNALCHIPGVAPAPGGVECTWDVAPIIAEKLGREVPTVPTEDNLPDDDFNTFVESLPGLAEYRALGLPEVARPYQKDDAIFLAYRAYAMLCLPPRAGKTMTALMAAKLIAAQRVLIICPAIVQRSWAREIGKWLKNSKVVIVVGRGANALRVMCRTCMGTRFVGADQCPDCQIRGRARGFTNFKIGWMKEETDSARAGWSWYSCRRHPDKKWPGVANNRRRCCECQKELIGHLEAADFVICGYSLLVSQRRKNENGRMDVDRSLPGAGPLLGCVRFDLAIGDELHYIRGHSTDVRRIGQTQRERFNQICDDIPIVWGLTATPIFGFIRDLWGQLDAISKGAVSGGLRRVPFVFHVAYCGGHKGEFGWLADSRSVLADAHLPRRLPTYLRIRSRQDIAPWLPKKERVTVHLDPDEAISTAAVRGSRESRFEKLVNRAFKAKVEPVTEAVVAELGAGEKSVIYTYSIASAKKMYDALAKAIEAKDVRTRMRQVDCQLWLAHGKIDADTRAVMCENFVRHTGAGVFIATIDSMPGGVSLKGATTVHFMEMHWQPAAIVQAENRPYEDGTERLTVIYYIVAGTIDEQLEQALLPKLDNLKLIGDSDASETKSALRANKANADEETLDDILNALGDSIQTDIDFWEEDEDLT